MQIVYAQRHPYACFLYMLYTLSSRTVLYLEPISSHASLVVVYEGEALFLGIVRCREEHAFVAFRLLIRADLKVLYEISTYLTYSLYKAILLHSTA
jgi:hypothetical protein